MAPAGGGGRGGPGPREPPSLRALSLPSILEAREFEWESQLRFYWDRDPDELNIRQCTGTFGYGYEYMGLNGRLVITPLTDRIYLTLTQVTARAGGQAVSGSMFATGLELVSAVSRMWVSGQLTGAGPLGVKAQDRGAAPARVSGIEDAVFPCLPSPVVWTMPPSQPAGPSGVSLYCPPELPKVPCTCCPQASPHQADAST